MIIFNITAILETNVIQSNAVRISNREISILILKFTSTQIKCKTLKHYHEASKIKKTLQALYFHW